MRYVILSILAVNLCYSQITVRNSNYIFADDLVLYSEDYVNLQDANSYMYLRNESQLIQGSGTTANSGSGYLSCYQDGTSNEYIYNYWCSPVENPDMSVTGFVPEVNLYDVTGLITSNIASFTMGFDGSSSPLVVSERWLYMYTPGTQYSDWDFVGKDGTVPPGYGFTMKGTSGSGNNQLYDFRGQPNSGNLFTSVLNGHETLVGNPYPSALDARDFIHDVTNSSLLDSGTLYFWEQDITVASHVLEDYRGGYATYTISSDGAVQSFVPATFDSYNSDGSFNSGGSTSTSGKRVYRYIPIGQGFMVRGAASGSIRTTNSMRDYYRESDPDSEFFRSPNIVGAPGSIIYNENGFQIVPGDYKRFRINIDFNNTYTRQLLLNFHHTATDGKDYGLESRSSTTLNSDAFLIQDDEPYNTQAFNFDETMSIPVTVTLDYDQSVRFRIFDIQNFEASQPIYIHDILSDLYIDLRTQHYDINLEAGTYSDRFEIVFSNAALSIDDETLKSNFKVVHIGSSSTLKLLNPDYLKVKTIAIYDITGKSVTHIVNPELNSEYEVNSQSLSTGTYIVNVTFDDGVSDLSQKVIIN